MRRERRRACEASVPDHVMVAAVVLTVVAAVVVALAGHPVAAVRVIAGLCGALALARAVLPGRPWMASRNRLVDVVVCALLAVGLWVLSPWANTGGLV